MTQDKDELVVRDLGSTNGIRINGQRVEVGRLRPGDELSIAHIRFRLDNGQVSERTLADPMDQKPAAPLPPMEGPPFGVVPPKDNPLAAAVRELLPAGVAERCRIQVIVQMRNDEDAAEKPDACQHNSSP